VKVDQLGWLIQNEDGVPMAFLMELDQSGCMALAKTKTIFQWPY
jgi:hypothetical protein